MCPRPAARQFLPIVVPFILALACLAMSTQPAPAQTGTACGDTAPGCGGDCPAGLSCTFLVDTGECLCGVSFPAAGTDLSPSTGIFRVDAVGIGLVDATVSGEILLQWQDPQTDPVSGQRTVQTEMLSMDLSGSHPVLGSIQVRAGALFGLPPSRGNVVPLGTGGDFPALATFDVFFEVEILGVATLRNDQPLVMQAEIDQIPPRNLGLQNLAPVTLTDIQNPTHVDTLQTALHWMCPPPFPPPGVPCPVPCDQNPFPVCGEGDCPPGTCLGSTTPCQTDADCGVAGSCIGGGQECVPNTATGACECVEDFPPAGTDLSPTTGIFRVDVMGVGSVDTSVSGETLLQWQDPDTDPVSGQRTVQTEMLSMDLSGAHPDLGTLSIRAGSLFGLPATTGSVTPIAPGSTFPAQATFDVFFEVVVAGVATLRNDKPLVMQAVINEIPPRNIGLENLGSVLLRDVLDPTHIDILQTALHWMCPPPFPPPGVPCPVPCSRSPYPVCSPGDCPAGEQCARDESTRSCRCTPGFPPAGVDLSPSVGVFRVDVIGIGEVDTSVSGELLLEWQDPQTDPVTGQRTVQTEMLSMDLSGSDPLLGNLNVTAGALFGLPPTLGSVVPLDPGSDFPARATFDVFFEVDVGTTTLRNDEPLVMEADISEIPPRNIGLQNLEPVVLIDIQNPANVDTIQTALHWMCPPPFPPPGIPCPVPCDQNPFPVCGPGSCPPNETCAPDPADGRCRCVGSFPPAGVDLSPSVGVFRVDVLGIGPVDTSVSGEILLEWQDPQTDPVSGQRTVQTEMLSMDLSGSHPSIGNLDVRAGSVFGLPATLGSVVPLGPESDFPALATFDVFFEVDVLGVATLRNDQPLVMEAVITEIPPRNIGLRNVEPVVLTDPQNPTHVSELQTALHWMCPPPFPPPGVPCPVPCDQSPFPVCGPGDCPADRPLCVPDSATQRCTCVSQFPPAGFDLSPTTGLVEVDVLGVGPVEVEVSGETLLSYGDAQTDPVSGERTVQTEMVSLSLSGSSPLIGNLRVRAGADFGLPQTVGTVVPLVPGGPDFPALANFDVFFEVEVVGQATLRNSAPLQMQAQVIQLPPRNLGLQNAAPVQIVDIQDPTHVDTILTAFHWMCPPPFPPPGVPCPVPCGASPVAVCGLGDCPPGLECRAGTGSGCACLPAIVGSGEIPCTGPDSLRLAPAAGGALRLDWGPSCVAADTDYGVYSGTLVAPFDSHGPVVCSTGGLTTATIFPAAGADEYYLVVPNNGSREGSYGLDSGGTPRPQGTPVCQTQLAVICP